MIDIPIYYINMDKDKDRNENMKINLEKYSSNFKRISAINGKKISDLRGDEIDGIKFKVPKNRKRPTRNEMGCLLSHIKTIEQIEKDNNDIAIIFEDDIEFTYIDKWDDTIENIIKNAPSDWSIIKLHTNNYRFTEILIKSYNRDKKYYEGYPVRENYSTAAYIINKKTIELLKQNIIIPILMNGY